MALKLYSELRPRFKELSAMSRAELAKDYDGPAYIAYMLRTGGFEIKRRDGWYSGSYNTDWRGLLSIHDEVLFNRVSYALIKPNTSLLVAIMTDFDECLAQGRDTSHVRPFVSEDPELAARHGLKHALKFLTSAGAAESGASESGASESGAAKLKTKEEAARLIAEAGFCGLEELVVQRFGFDVSETTRLLQTVL